jgi:hypothetical protein
MKRLMLVVLAVLVLTFAVTAHAADVTLKWDAADGATGYILEMSTDNGTTWVNPIDVGNVTTYQVTGVPDSGMVLFRNTAYNTVGQTVRYEAGAWFNGDWKQPSQPGLGVQ